MLWLNGIYDLFILYLYEHRSQTDFKKKKTNNNNKFLT